MPIVRWGLGHIVPPGHYWEKNVQTMVDTILDRTDGRFEITQYPGGSLGIEAGEYQFAVGEGVIEMGMVGVGHASGVLPWIGIFQQPFLLSWPDDYYQLAEKVQPIMERELRKIGITPRAFGTHDPTYLYTKAPLEDVADLKGLKIRVWDEPSAHVGELLNANPIIISYLEVYLALQRGVVDGYFSGVGGIFPISAEEFIKHAYALNLPSSSYYIAYNNENFHDLPYEYQIILEEELESFTERAFEGSWPQLETEFEKFRDAGIEIHEVDPEIMRMISDKFTTLWQEWADDGGPVAQEMLEIAFEMRGG
ncbi:MAG: TRAP transporter substrate-binding protein DctP [Chloroflexota bacterium]|nr:MAG: TRAP transporter substrate-binding protein DctP [Chloroflexota bacterium]